MCAGAINGPHIPILAPEENQLVYVNRKGYHSIIMELLWILVIYLEMWLLVDQGVEQSSSSCATLIR